MARIQRTAWLLILPAIFAAGTMEAGLWDQVKNVFATKEKPKPPRIKVLVAHDVESAKIEVHGKHHVRDPFKNANLTTHYTTKSGVIEAKPTGLKWGEVFPGVYQLHLIPDSPSTITIIEGIPYHGEILVYDIGGSISIINHVDIEDYLNSTMKHLEEKELSDETLAAAVIAARTHAYYQAHSASNPYWHVRASDVKYLGHAPDAHATNVGKALATTRHMVLSQTGTYEGMLTPFPIEVLSAEQGERKGKGYSFSVDEADYLAQRGDNAAQILSQTFPNSTIELNFHGHHHYVDASDIAERPQPRQKASPRRTFR